jgi:hypothetical protein
MALTPDCAEALAALPDPIAICVKADETLGGSQRSQAVAAS